MARGSAALDRSADGGLVGGDPSSEPESNGSVAIMIRLDELLTERAMTLTELSERVGITVVNLSILKNGRARAIRFSTLAALCAELGCQPGDLLRYEHATSRSEPGPPEA